MVEMSEQHFCLGELLCKARILTWGTLFPNPLFKIRLLFYVNICVKC